MSGNDTEDTEMHAHEYAILSYVGESIKCLGNVLTNTTNIVTAFGHDDKALYDRATLNEMNNELDHMMTQFKSLQSEIVIMLEKCESKAGNDDEL